MRPIWGRQDPGGSHVGPMNFALWVPPEFKLDGNLFHLYASYDDETVMEYYTWHKFVAIWLSGIKSKLNVIFIEFETRQITLVKTMFPYIQECRGLSHLAGTVCTKHDYLALARDHLVLMPLLKVVLWGRLYDVTSQQNVMMLNWWGLIIRELSQFIRWLIQSKWLSIDTTNILHLQLILTGLIPR